MRAKTFGNGYLHSFSQVVFDKTISIVNLLNKFFLAASSEERECGCSSLAIIGKKKSVAEIIIDKKLMRIIAPLVLDKNISVQHAAVGALRNISLSDPTTCDHMVDQDVFTPLSKLLRQYQESDWQVGKKANRIDSKCEIFIEAVNLLWNLCEANETIVNKCLEQDMLTILMKHLAVEKYGYKVVTTVLQCIYTLSEDCTEVHLNVFKNFDPLLNSLLVQNAESSEGLHVKVLAFGIVANLLEARKESVEPIISDLMNALSKTLDQDQRKLVHDYSSCLPMEDKSAGDQMEEDSDAVPRYESLRREIDHVLLGQQMALEILANLCCGEVNDWEETSASEESDDEEGNEMRDEDMDLEPTKMSSILLEAIKSHEFLDKVLSKAKLPAENVQDILKSPTGLQQDGGMVLQMLQTLQSKTFLCLNNLIEAVSMEDLGGENKLFQVWKDLGSLSLSANSEQVVESATSAMRASTQKLTDSKLLHQIGSQEVDQLAEYGAKHNNASIRTNIVAILGTIGQCLATQLETSNQPGPLHLTISRFLLEAASRDVELRVVAEALDKVFDMFSEDYTDKLCAQVQVVQRLKQLQPGLKVKINMNRKNQRNDPDTNAMAMMAKTNLTRFIKYKEQHRKSQNGNH